MNKNENTESSIDSFQVLLLPPSVFVLFKTNALLISIISQAYNTFKNFTIQGCYK